MPHQRFQPFDFLKKIIGLQFRNNIFLCLVINNIFFKGKQIQVKQKVEDETFLYLPMQTSAPTIADNLETLSVANDRASTNDLILSANSLTLSQTCPEFYVSAVHNFRKHCGEKENLLVTNSFSFYHKVFYRIPSLGY